MISRLPQQVLRVQSAPDVLMEASLAPVAGTASSTSHLELSSASEMTTFESNKISGESWRRNIV